MRAKAQSPLVPVIVFLVLFGGAAAPRPASADAWVPLGPDGGAVTAIAVHPGDSDTL